MFRDTTPLVISKAALLQGQLFSQFTDICLPNNDSLTLTGSEEQPHTSEVENFPNRRNKAAVEERKASLWRAEKVCVRGPDASRQRVDGEMGR